MTWRGWTFSLSQSKQNISPQGHSDGGTGESIYGKRLKYMRNQNYIAG